jgi:hypothetical protein
VTNRFSDSSHSFTAFSSALKDAAQQKGQATARVETERGRGGANARPDEVTRLERRVLAHERILQALIARLAGDDPDILTQLKSRFGTGHDLGEYEQDFVSTDHYGDHFIRSVERQIVGRENQ